ncbi:MAG: hypothetical protein M1821_003137 [Bathelium mastoideum]|nr:MAG: hypothetical protein M1821_003137 [Bathelium mastoideum]
MVQTTLASWLNKPRNDQENARTGTAADTRSGMTTSTYMSLLSSFPIDPTHPIKAGETLRSSPRTPPRPSMLLESRISPSKSTSQILSMALSTPNEAPNSSSTPPTLPLNPPHPLPPTVTLSPITSDTLSSLQRLNALMLPIGYPSSFYAETINDPSTAALTLLAFWHDSPSDPGIAVGSIRCKLLPPPPPAPSPPSPSSTAQGQPTPPTLYISTLAVLTPYCNHGLASHMLAQVCERAAREHGVRHVGAHVWAANEDALAWYERRGFERVGWEVGYYPRLKPQEAWRIGRRIGLEEGKEEDGREGRKGDERGKEGEGEANNLG